jgi:hypothetical protein
MSLIIEAMDKKAVYSLNNMNFHPKFAFIGQKVNIRIKAYFNGINLIYNSQSQFFRFSKRD